MLTQEQIRKMADTIKTRVNPDKIYLFGSYASNRATETSDLDLLVVDDSARDKKALALEISKTLFPRSFGLDLLVMSSKEMEKRKQLLFWRNMTAKSELLYERK